MDCACVMDISMCMWINAVLFIGYFTLGIYLDNVWPNENGVRKGILYFLSRNYWR